MPPRHEVGEVDELTGKWDKGIFYREDPDRPWPKKPRFSTQAELVETHPLPIAPIAHSAPFNRLIIHAVKPSQPTVWMKEEDIFVGYNTKKVDIPERPRNAFSPKQYTDLQWEQPGLPYLPFVSVGEKFNSHLLRRLNVNTETVPVVYDGHMANMQERLVDSWVRLERNLLRIVDILKAVTRYTDVRFPPHPRSTRLYKKYVWTQADEIRREALEVRDRFVPLIALVAFFVSLRMNTQEYILGGCSKGKTGRWSQYQADLTIAGVHPQWIVLMNDSPAFPGKICSHRGVIVDYRSSEFSVFVPFMIDCGVPVILRIDARTADEDIHSSLHYRFFSIFQKLGFSSLSVENINAALRKYIPPAAIVDNIRSQLSVQKLQESFDFSLDPEPEAGPSTPRTWKPISDTPSSSKVQTETREDFFARRDRERADYIATESIIQKQGRESRESAARTFPVPGERSKVKVYVWNWDGTQEVRTLAERGEHELLWAEFKPTEMRFNGIRNEWDLWHETHPGKGLQLPTEEEEEEEDWCPVDAPGELPAFNNHSFRDEALDIFGFKLDRSDGHFVEAVKYRDLYPLTRRLQVFYGFSTLNRDESVRIPDRLNKERIRHILHDSITELDDESLHTRLSQFVAYLIDIKSPSSPLYDLHAARRHRFGNPAVLVRPSLFTAKEFEDTRSPNINLYSVELLDSHGQPRHDRAMRRFFVWNATTAVAIKRFAPTETESFDSIALVLLQIGVPFILATPCSRLSTPSANPRVSGLGTWTMETKRNDPLDFIAYMRKCRELFSIRRLRKCLRYGGIIWRLACIYLETADGLDAPSPDALNEPQILSGPEDLVEDGISRDEIDLLIGTFYILPEIGATVSPVRYSYWPPPYIWSSQGDCVGPWTPDNEDWFLNRIRLYLEGSAALFAIDDWKRKVSGFTESKDMMKNIEVLSKQFLS